ncbi:MAG: DEAD/DEAH box helicase [Bacteroidota bacterium]
MISACHAGYLLPAFHDALLASELIGNSELRALWRNLCSVECETALDLFGRKVSDDPILLTAANMISRGLPTLPSAAFEKKFADTFKRFTFSEDERGVLCSRIVSPEKEFLSLILHALHAVSPPSDEDIQLRLGKTKAAPLLKPLVPLFRQLFGNASLQLLESDEKHGYLLLPFFQPIGGVRGVRARTVAKEGGSEQSGLQSDGWFAILIAPGNAQQLQKDIAALKKAMSADFSSRKMAFDAGSLLATGEGREALQLALSPLGAARVQRALMQVLIAGGLDLAAASWTITVIERDLPCAALGIGEFRRLLQTLFTLEGKGRRVPEIDATVVAFEAFKDSKLHIQNGVRLVGKGAAISSSDVLLDVSVLHRSGERLPDIKAEAKTRVTLRTSRGNAEPGRFQLTETLAWKPLSVKGSAALDPEILQTVKSLLEDFFRVGRPTQEQLQLIDQVLQNRSFLAALPAMSGKSLLYQFAGLLQPALSFAVFPLASLVIDQREQLGSVFIDCVECLHEGLGKEARMEVRERFRNREALFLFISAEVFRNEEIDELLESIRKDKGYFAQCVIDEAQCMSDWSHEPRPLMLRAPAFMLDRMVAGKNKYVAVRFLTASNSLDVVSDLRSQLSGLGRAWSLENEQCVVMKSALWPQQQFQVAVLPSRGGDIPTLLQARQRGAADALRAQRESFGARHEQAPVSHRVPGYSASASLPTVLYCPYSSGTLGVTNRYAAGVSEAALDEALKMPGHRIGSYIGNDGGHNQVGRHGVNDAIEQSGLFRSGANSLLLATRAYGVGTHKPDIRCTMHLLPPPGVERFVQECGRGGRDRRLSLHTVMFGGEAREGESLDLRLGAAILSASASDPAREKQLIHDLMMEISFPEDSNTNRIANLVTDEFGVEVRISYWQRGLEERMYVQHEGNIFGYIDLVTQALVPEPKCPDQVLAKETIEFAFATSLDAAGGGQSLSSWVAATFAADIDDGIARQMQDFEAGSVFTLRVGYENDREPLLNQIHQVLWRQAEIEIQRKIFADVPGNNWPEFREQLILRVGRPDLFAKLDRAIEARLVNIFNMIRTRSDTERIMFRLATLGVLHDYKTHPAARRYSLRIAVRADHEIRSSLEQYLGLFLTPRQVERKLEALSSYKADTLLERCLYLLIDFSNEYCNRKQLASARLMDSLCLLAMKNDDNNLRELIEKALTAKYALPSKLPAALGTVTSRIALLEQYMLLMEEDRTGSMFENAAQLKASCELLARSFPDEPALPLLKAFAGLVFAEEKSWKSASEEFAAAFGRAASASGLQGESYLAAVSDFDMRLRRCFDDQSVAMTLSQLHDEVKRVQSKPLPAAVSVETLAAQKQSAAEQRAAEQKAAEQRAAEQRAAEQRAAEQRAAEQKAAEQKAAEQKAAEQKTAEQKTAEQKTAEQKTAEQKTTEQKTAEQRTTEPASRSSNTGLSNASGHPGGFDELDQMLAEIEGILVDIDSPRTDQQSVDLSNHTPADAARTTARTASPDRLPIPPAVDPQLLQHLKWLQMFNHSFLKHYES